MKLGVMIEGQQGLTWERWRRIMVATEEMGFESLWRSDHFQPLFGDQDQEALETWVSLTLAAAETSRLIFGPLVCSMTFRHPSLLARMAAAVDELSGGRLVLGVGAGWNEPEHRAFGLPFPPPKQRLDLLEDSCQIITRLMGDGTAAHEGKQVTIEGARMLPKPLQRPRTPLLIGGGGVQRTLKIVARYADEWNTPPNPVPVYKEKAAKLAEYCAAIGRDPATIRHSMMCAFVVGENAAGVERHAARLKGMMARFATLETSAIPEMVRSAGWLAGTPDQMIAQLKELEAAGIQRVMLQHHDQENFDVLRLIAREVIPAVA